MILLTQTGGIAATNAFVIADESASEAVLFDAPNDTVAPLLDEIAKRGWKLKDLWLTHGHFDHTADHKVVTDRFPDAKVLIHRLDEPKLKNPKAASFPLPFVIPPRAADGYLEDGQQLTRTRSCLLLSAGAEDLGRRRFDHHGRGRPDGSPGFG
jgi:glyoxylase-like metal-dependent hydrolase (beta-lactamase superfamily II)